MEVLVSHDELNLTPALKRLSEHHFAARPWPYTGSSAKTIDYHYRSKRLIAPLPPATFVGLPIGYVESPGLAVGPGLARRSKRIGILPVKEQNDAVVGLRVRRQGSIVDQEPHIGPVRIAVLDRQRS